MRADSVTIAVLLVSLGLSGLGCARHTELANRQVSSVRDPRLRGWFWNDVCGVAGLVRDVQTPVKFGDEPRNGGNPWHLSNPVGLLRLANCFAAGDRMEYRRGLGQFR